jgi:hypothetical protein
MQVDDLIRRNRELLVQAEAVTSQARELAAETLGHRSAVDHARNRMRKALRARALWPRFLRRLYPRHARPP